MTEHPRIVVSRKASRCLHPWVFSNEVREAPAGIERGAVVGVVERNRFIGSAIYSPNSLIRARLFSREDRELDADLFARRLARALENRACWLPAEQDYRLVHGESDGLPGLTIDRYGRCFALQAFSAGMDCRLGLVVDALRSLFDVEAVWARNDFALRELEGLPRHECLLWGSQTGDVVIAENAVRFQVDVASGQKTGFYFDQRLNRARIRCLSREKSVLDLFCYSGGFAVNAALGGASRVLAVDSSRPSCVLVERNAALNGVAERVEAACADASELLQDLHSRNERFDVIVVDPPPFARRLRDRPRALRAYRDVNLQAIRLLAPRGVLLSCTCSQHISWSDLAMVLAQAAQAAGREFRIVERTGQSPDHPVLLHMPESEYLRSYLVQLT